MKCNLRKNENGFVLVLCMIMLVVLTLMGIVGTRTTTIELLISGNEKVGTETFYQADGATQVGIELVEQNTACPIGFTKTGGGFDSNDPATFFSIYGVDVFDASFSYDMTQDEIAKNQAVVGTSIALSEMPSKDARTLRIPGNTAPGTRDNAPVTNLAIFGDSDLSTGSNIRMAEGYDGKAKSAAGGGAFIAYQIHSQHQGLTSSESIVRLDWQHVIGTEGDTCEY